MPPTQRDPKSSSSKLLLQTREQSVQAGLGSSRPHSHDQSLRACTRWARENRSTEHVYLQVPARDWQPGAELPSQMSDLESAHDGPALRPTGSQQSGHPHAPSSPKQPDHLPRARARPTTNRPYTRRGHNATVVTAAPWNPATHAAVYHAVQALETVSHPTWSPWQQAAHQDQ